MKRALSFGAIDVDKPAVEKPSDGKPCGPPLRPEDLRIWPAQYMCSTTVATAPFGISALVPAAQIIQSEWQCSLCGKLTRDTGFVSDNCWTDVCIACRGFVTADEPTAREMITAAIQFRNRLPWP
jgi:hypothetical protein